MINVHLWTYTILILCILQIFSYLMYFSMNCLHVVLLLMFTGIIVWMSLAREAQKVKVGVPEWLSGMTRNHVGSARAGSNPAAHVFSLF